MSLTQDIKAMPIATTRRTRVPLQSRVEDAAELLAPTDADAEATVAGGRATDGDDPAAEVAEVAAAGVEAGTPVVYIEPVRR